MRIIDVLTNQTVTPGAPERVNMHNLIILDESGSMSFIEHAAVQGVNSTLATIREAQRANPEQHHTVTLKTFNSCHHNLIYGKAPIAAVSDLNPRQYDPAGGTPLYDAMGSSIIGLRKRIAPNDVVLVTIITDGMENDSHHFNAHSIKALVEEMKAKGWVFTYIGANQDVEAVAKGMAIDNHLEWDATEEGLNDMFVTESNARMNFFSRLKGRKNATDIQNDYFQN